MTSVMKRQRKRTGDLKCNYVKFVVKIYMKLEVTLKKEFVQNALKNSLKSDKDEERKNNDY